MSNIGLENGIYANQTIKLGKHQIIKAGDSLLYWNKAYDLREAILRILSDTYDMDKGWCKFTLLPHHIIKIYYYLQDSVRSDLRIAGISTYYYEDLRRLKILYNLMLLNQNELRLTFYDSY